MLHDFLCLLVKKWNLQMYSIAKIHYTTITMNKEGTARFVKTKQTKKLLSKVRLKFFFPVSGHTC